jgi:hypothetical protein
MSTLWQVVLVFGAVIAVLLLGLVILTIWWEWRWRHLPPRPPLRCPTCNSDQIDIYSGLWDGHDEHGQRTGGGDNYGICKECGALCGWINDRSFILTPAEWNIRMGSTERMLRERESWPFEPSDTETKI